MDVTPILDPLNDAQRAAVSAEPGNLLVLAGAGSGKTRVLVHRIAWLLQVEQVPPWAILAVTFTNKAARELRGRLQELLGGPVGGLWAGTFHGLGHRFLRAHWQDAGLPQSFQILDADDQFRMIRRLLKERALDEARWPPKQIQGYINRQKDEGLRPDHLDPAGDFYLEQMIRIYREYEQARIRGGLLDFADLLLCMIELLRARSDLLHHYQQRFRHLLVDEFQDTNALQYAWLRLLNGDGAKLFAVGDDDQSIYGWRGARVENLHALQHDYPAVRLLRLEQNYRSTGTILAAANALIAHNPTRLGKTLWTQDAAGEPLRRYTAFNDVDEARFVVDRIQRHLLEPGTRRDDCAILYRTTAQSRLFEEALIQAGIPYRVYGGLRFFERAEIRDLLAYLRLVASPDDDAAFERVINVPARGIGARTLEQVREQARALGASRWRAAAALTGSGLSARAGTALRGFVALIETQRAAQAAGQSLDALVTGLIAATRIDDFYRASKDGRGQDRIENLAQLVATVQRFAAALDDAEALETAPDLAGASVATDPLRAFLAHAALESGDTPGDEAGDQVQLMTLHSAKGLEFPIVFLVGLEDGLFPHSLSSDSPERLEEERRLCYVGLTRARRQLYLTHAQSRSLYGREEYPLPSRFLNELPVELIEEIRGGGRMYRRSTAPAVTHAPRPVATDGSPGMGQRVIHPTFGEGVVQAIEGQGAQTRIQVRFQRVGSKWLVLAYARLEIAG